MHGTVGNEEQIMLCCRKPLYILFNVYRNVVLKAVFQLPPEGLRVDVILKAQVYLCVRCTVQDVVRLILGNHLAEVFTDIGQRRMALDGQIASIKRVQKIKTDGKLAAEVPRALTEHPVPFHDNQIGMTSW